MQMNSQEKALVFYCNGEPLIGIVHIPDNPRRQGVISIVADAPQYRPGNCRQLLQFARYLASNGTPVLRFDYRGMGDSGGTFPGLEREDDIEAALSIFIKEVPEMKEVILYGGCDAASVIAIHGWRFPEVTGWVLANPWVHTEEGHAQVMIEHYYLERLRSRDFWNKIFSFNFDLKESLYSFLQIRKTAKSEKNKGLSNEIDPADISQPFELRMFAGWKKFAGRVLIIKGDRSIVAKEFDSFVEQSATRKQLLGRENVQQFVVKNADHAFSIPEARDALFLAVNDWLEAWH